FIDEPGNVIQPVGAYARREAEGSGIGDADCIVYIPAPNDRDDRTEGLFADQLAIEWHVVNDRRWEQCALPVVSVQQLRALRHCILHPAFEQAGGCLRDDRPDIDFRILRIAGLELLRLREHRLDERVSDLLGYYNAFDSRTALT